MRFVKGKVKAGKIVVEGEQLCDGAEVVVGLADESAFELTPEQEQLLLLSVREADEGRLIDGPAVMRELERIK
ncbi:MAG: hypothetical protein FJ091_06450 [Deltaproteobacteria bacterium]|nr:hypothetical protein [Deltaproteobacteria bacterium]